MLGDCTKETREIARRVASGDECGERGVGVGVCRSIQDLRRRVGAALQEEEPSCECVRARSSCFSVCARACVTARRSVWSSLSVRTLLVDCMVQKGAVHRMGTPPLE